MNQHNLNLANRSAFMADLRNYAQTNPAPIPGATRLWIQPTEEHAMRRQRKKDRAAIRAKRFRKAVRYQLERWRDTTDDPAQRAALDEFLSLPPEALDLFVETVEENTDTGRPLLDALADLIRDWTSNPMKWIEVIKAIIPLFTGFALGITRGPSPLARPDDAYTEPRHAPRNSPRS